MCHHHVAARIDSCPLCHGVHNSNKSGAQPPCDSRGMPNYLNALVGSTVDSSRYCSSCQSIPSLFRILNTIICSSPRDAFVSIVSSQLNELLLPQLFNRPQHVVSLLIAGNSAGTPSRGPLGPLYLCVLMTQCRKASLDDCRPGVLKGS